MYRVLLLLLSMIFVSGEMANANTAEVIQPAKFIAGPRAFNNRIKFLRNLLRLPDIKAIVFCSTSVSRSGKLSGSQCSTSGPKQLAKHVLDALPKMQVQAASGASGPLRVQMNFAVMISKKQEKLVTLLLQNHLLNGAAFGAQYQSAQRVVSLDVDLNACPIKPLITVKARVTAKGELESIESINPLGLPRACEKSLRKFMRRSRYVAAQLGGAVVAAAYQETFKVRPIERYQLDIARASNH